MANPLEVGMLSGTVINGCGVIFKGSGTQALRWKANSSRLLIGQKTKLITAHNFAFQETLDPSV